MYENQDQIKESVYNSIKKGGNTLKENLYHFIVTTFSCL